VKGWWYMTSEEIIFQQYKLYSEQKEEFINRSFMTNKFYLFLILGLLLAMFKTNGLTFVYGMTSSMIFSGAGMAICTLWWINVDSYNFLIKIKFSKVLDEIEKQLPVKPYTDEFEAIRNYKKNKREFLFADIQKALAIFVFLMFFVLFVHEFLKIVLG
jgi:hypothetical protein